jgi:formylglycine-generating enzyme required for sulfatase activity
LLRMDAAEQMWPLLKHSADPRVRSYIIHWLSPRGGDVAAIITRYEQEQKETIKCAMLLCLGEFELADAEQQPLLEKLLDVYRTDPDAGLHAAAEWLLRQWKQAEKIAAIDKELRQSEGQLTNNTEDKREWYINGQGQTFVILDASEFLMGSPESETGRNPTERLHRRKIGRQFAISTKEVTTGQWRVFDESPKGMKRAADPARQPNISWDAKPKVGMTWYQAASYCNWLSDQEGIAEDQWCYQKNAEDKSGPGMKAKENFGELTGYRLPTDAEWEFACRAGTGTKRYYGETESLLPRYAWCQINGKNRTWPVASLKPNDFGLFDMQGNVSEWANDLFSGPDSKDAAADAPNTNTVSDSSRRGLRGGSFNIYPPLVSSGFRSMQQPSIRFFSFGFRPSRTYPLTAAGG